MAAAVASSNLANLEAAVQIASGAFRLEALAPMARLGWNQLGENRRRQAWALGRDSLEGLSTLIDCGMPFDWLDKDGYCPLERQTLHRRLDLMELLIARGACPDTPGDGGWTPLILAAANGMDKEADLLLSHGARPDFVLDDGDAPMHLAARHGSDEQSLKILTALLDAGACLDAPDGQGETPLMRALYRDTLEVPKMLLARGARLDVTDSRGRTPITAARGAGTPLAEELAQFLEAAAALREAQVLRESIGPGSKGRELAPRL